MGGEGDSVAREALNGRDKFPSLSTHCVARAVNFQDVARRDASLVPCECSHPQYTKVTITAYNEDINPLKPSG